VPSPATVPAIQKPVGPQREPAQRADCPERKPVKGLLLIGVTVVVIGVAAVVILPKRHVPRSSDRAEQAAVATVTSQPEAVPAAPAMLVAPVSASAKELESQPQSTVGANQTSPLRLKGSFGPAEAGGPFQPTVDEGETMRLRPDNKAKRDEQKASLVGDQRYLDAVSLGRSLVEQCDYEGALAMADKALALKPGDPEAVQLKKLAHGRLEELRSTEERERKYQTALAAASEALARQDLAIAHAWANAALALKPNDEAATKIRAQAVEFSDLAAVQACLDRADYEKAWELIARHGEAGAFKQLATVIRTEQAALADATVRFERGDYGFVKELKASTFASKPPFAQLLQRAAAEAQVLAELKTLRQANNAQALLAKLADPPASSFAGKPPFLALAQWAQAQSAQATGSNKLDQLDAEFEKMLVWFNIKNPKDAYLRTAEAKKERRLDGEIGVKQRQQFLDAVNRLENEFRKGGWLDQRERARYLTELRTTIMHRE
jgi:hypothetical protein